eukprot:7364680-Pyramimonas_sp.AAC.1
MGRRESPSDSDRCQTENPSPRVYGGLGGVESFASCGQKDGAPVYYLGLQFDQPYSLLQRPTDGHSHCGPCVGQEWTCHISHVCPHQTARPEKHGHRHLFIRAA